MNPAGLRLAYLSSDPGIPADGTKGASVHFRELARALSQQGVLLDAFVARSLEKPVSPWWSLQAIPCDRRPGGIEGEVRLLAAQAPFVDALQRSGPHDAVYERFSLFGLAGLAYSQSLKVPYILEVNSPIWLEAQRFRSLHLHRAAQAISLEVLHGADRVLVVSEELRSILRDEGVDDERILVLRNGINKDLFEGASTARRPPELEGRSTLVFVGSLKPWHGIEFLLEAFARAPRNHDVGLWIVGDGPLRSLVEKSVKKSKRVIVYQRAVEHEAIPSILKAADIAVVPYTESSPRYFCPLKVIEAMAAGVPLLASDTPAVREVVGDPPCAELFVPGDGKSFIAAMERLLDEPRRRELLSTRGRDSALSDFTWESRARKIIELLRRDSVVESQLQEVAR